LEEIEGVRGKKPDQYFQIPPGPASHYADPPAGDLGAGHRRKGPPHFVGRASATGGTLTGAGRYSRTSPADQAARAGYVSVGARRPEGIDGWFTVARQRLEGARQMESR